MSQSWEEGDGLDAGASGVIAPTEGGLTPVAKGRGRAARGGSQTPQQRQQKSRAAAAVRARSGVCPGRGWGREGGSARRDGWRCRWPRPRRCRGGVARGDVGQCCGGCCGVARGGDARGDVARRRVLLTGTQVVEGQRYVSHDHCCVLGASAEISGEAWDAT